MTIVYNATLDPPRCLYQSAQLGRRGGIAATKKGPFLLLVIGRINHQMRERACNCTHDEREISSQIEDIAPTRFPSMPAKDQDIYHTSLDC